MLTRNIPFLVLRELFRGREGKLRETVGLGKSSFWRGMPWRYGDVPVPRLRSRFDWKRRVGSVSLFMNDATDAYGTKYSNIPITARSKHVVQRRLPKQESSAYAQ